MMRSVHGWWILILCIGGVLLVWAIFLLNGAQDQSSPQKINGTQKEMPAAIGVAADPGLVSLSPMATLVDTQNITNYCDNIDRDTIPQRFDDVATKFDEKPKWERLEMHREIMEIYSSADAWVDDGSILFVVTQNTSASGDWFRYDHYCFRKDGTLAKVLGNLNTFYATEGAVTVNLDLYFDTNGNVIASSTKIVDLYTKEPSTSEVYQNTPLSIYKTTRDLPFLELVDLQRNITTGF